MAWSSSSSIVIVNSHRQQTVIVNIAVKTKKYLKRRLCIDFIAKFAGIMADAKKCPVPKEIPEKMKEKLDYYLNRKREK